MSSSGRNPDGRSFVEAIDPAQQKQGERGHQGGKKRTRPKHVDVGEQRRLALHEPTHPSDGVMLRGRLRIALRQEELGDTADGGLIVERGRSQLLDQPHMVELSALRHHRVGE